MPHRGRRHEPWARGYVRGYVGERGRFDKTALSKRFRLSLTRSGCAYLALVTKRWNSFGALSLFVRVIYPKTGFHFSGIRFSMVTIRLPPVKVCIAPRRQTIFFALFSRTNKNNPSLASNVSMSS